MGTGTRALDIFGVRGSGGTAAGGNGGGDGDGSLSLSFPLNNLMNPDLFCFRLRGTGGVLPTDVTGVSSGPEWGKGTGLLMASGWILTLDPALAVRVRNLTALPGRDVELLRDGGSLWRKGASGMA